jgi:DNA-binding NarL/FixJ family response regulator
MTANERILHADDTLIAREGFARLIETMEEDGHEIVGSAASIEEVDKLLETGLKPTVAFVDNSFPQRGDGEKAAKLIREKSPKTMIVSLSGEEGLTWGDYNLLKIMTRDQLASFLLDLKHERID